MIEQKLSNYMLTCEQAKELLDLIIKWQSGLFDNECSKLLLSCLMGYKNIFPEDCLFSGTVYRKTDNIGEESNPKNDIIYRMRSCSYIKGSNRKELLGLHYKGKYYQFTCSRGFVLSNIILYLCKILNQDYTRLHSYGIMGFNPYERAVEESEVVCIVSKKDLCKEKK